MIVVGIMQATNQHALAHFMHISHENMRLLLFIIELFFLAVSTNSHNLYYYKFIVDIHIVDNNNRFE